MEYARNEAMLNETDKDGFTTRTHMEGLAARGKADASVLRDLAGPPFPDCLSYLWDWTQQVHGRSGFSQVGLQPLSYTTIADWARLKDVQPKPHEVEAMIVLDAILCSKPKPEDEDEE